MCIRDSINSWDGRHHPMQKRLGGIWELFMPTMQEGDTYKYEIRTQQGIFMRKLIHMVSFMKSDLKMVQ